jgi:hypothetical protein
MSETKFGLMLIASFIVGESAFGFFLLWMESHL